MKKNIIKTRTETLPVAYSLIKKEYQPLVQLYLQFIEYVKINTNNMNISNFNKVKLLNELEEVFDNENDYGKDKLKFMVKLKKNFVKELLAPSLIRDVLNSAKKDSSDFEYKTWTQLVGYCSNSYGTIARFLLALYDESPSTYIPAATLLSAYQMLVMIKDVRFDTSILKRVYIPKDLLLQYDVKVKDLYDFKSTKQIKDLTADMLREIRKMIKDAEILPSIIKNKGLRMQFCMLVNAANILFAKIKHADVLAKEIELSKLDVFESYISGVIDGFFTSYKDASTKGMKR
ncbi:MAG: squalene/phytoene synthase family protein [Lactobacillaceae bacterium]|jgi:phytoene/squalene synthetase|nr:squalene/phytoene synthase family protein [Lactobacillaceae bacterium]